MMDAKEDFQNYFKSKRDQYIVDIRKQKNDNLIMSKRMKLALGSSEIQPKLVKESGSPKTESDIQKQFDDFALSFANTLKSSEYELLSEIVECIRRAISHEDNPPLEQLANTGIINKIIELLDPNLFQYEKLMTECSWIIANVASGTSVYVDYIVNLGIVSKAVDLFDHPNMDVKENAVWILANVVGESIEYRDRLLEGGIVTRIETMLQECTNPQSSFIAQVAWLISVLLGGKPQPNFDQVAPFLKYLGYFISNVDHEETFGYTLWAYSHISNGDSCQIQQVLDTNPCEKLLSALKSDNLQVKVPALRTIGNLLTGEDNQIEILLRLGVIEALFPLLSYSRKLIRRETCWALSNILASNENQIQEVFDFRDGIIIKKLFLMAEKEDFEVAKECIICLTNVCFAGTAGQIIELVNQNVIETLIEAMKKNNEVRLLKPCLEALENIFEEFKRQGYLGRSDVNVVLEKLAQCGGYAVIEGLQEHSDNGIYASVSRLIERYFDFD